MESWFFLILFDSIKEKIAIFGGVAYFGRRQKMPRVAYLGGLNCSGQAPKGGWKSGPASSARTLPGKLSVSANHGSHRFT